MSDDENSTDHSDASETFNKEDFVELTVQLVKAKYWDPVKKCGKKIECFSDDWGAGVGRCLEFTPSGDLEVRVDNQTSLTGTIVKFEGPYDRYPDFDIYRDWLSGPAAGPYPDNARRCKIYATYFALLGRIDFLQGGGDEEGGLQIGSAPLNGVCNNAANGPLFVRRDDSAKKSKQ